MRIRVRGGDGIRKGTVAKMMQPQYQESGQPLDAGKGQETDSPLEPPEETQPC